MGSYNVALKRAFFSLRLPGIADKIDVSAEIARLHFDKSY